MSAPCQTPPQPLSAQQRMESCQGLVRSLATRIHRQLPPHFELDDLIAYGQVGLAEAARDFDPTRGIEFTTFAYYRTRGAIYDGLSKLTWLSRPHYRRLRFDRLADEVLQADSEESEYRADDSVQAMRWFHNLTRTLTVVYLTTRAEGEEDSPQSLLADDSASAPPMVAIDHEVGQKLRELIEDLPPEERSLVRAVYFEGITLQEAGERLAVSKSWASRLHARALKRLGHQLDHLGLGS